MKDLARSPAREFEARIAAVENSPTDDFRELLARAGLRPERDLRFGDFSGCPFNGDNLGGCDLTGCDLTRSTFENAEITGAIFDFARFDPGALQKASDYPRFLKNDLARPPASRHRLPIHRLADLDTFREAPFAPEMVALPAGEFEMGSALGEDELSGDYQAYPDEIVPGLGKRRMRIPARFALGRYPVTFEEYDVFCEAEGRERPPDEEWGRARRPAINLSWNDAMAYVAWLNKTIGVDAYRLPSEAQWEYACRAGTVTRRWWGDDWDANRANGDRSFGDARTSPVDHYPANPWKLHDMMGNVNEWCADVYVGNISELPDDGLPLLRTEDSKNNKNNSAVQVLRGGSWYNFPRYLRSADRVRSGPDGLSDDCGFRVSRTL